MSVDLYQPCPAGLDKKIKFCCKDLAHELDKITKLVKADQDKAALEYVERLIPKYPDRQCLLAWRSRLRIALVSVDEARPAVEAFLELAPDNAVAYCNLAIVEARTLDEDESQVPQQAATSETSRPGPDSTPAAAPSKPVLTASGRRAIDALQAATERLDRVIPGHLPSAFVMVARRLFMEGFPIAAREHLGFAVLLQKNSEHPLGVQDLIDSYETRDFSLLLKDSATMPKCPSHTTWRGEYLQAANETIRGRWRSALRRIVKLDAGNPDHPTLVLALANLHLRLAEDEQAVARLRQFARLPGVSEADAAYTEALALTLAPVNLGDAVEMKRETYPVLDMERLSELLLSSKRIVPNKGNMADFAEADEPPPRMAVTVLDRERSSSPDKLEELTVGDIPIVVGEAYLFGKQTDREARLEVDISLSNRVDSVREWIESLAGTVATEPEAEEVIDHYPAEIAALTVSCSFPDGTPVELQEKLSAQKFREYLLGTWPDTPLNRLDGKTPREAAAETGEYRTRVMALILRLEAEYLPALRVEDFDDLYRLLNLPIPQPKSIFIDDLANSPAVRLARVDPEPLSDKALVSAFKHAITVVAPAAIRRFGLEIIRRGKIMEQEVDAEGVFVHLARHAESTTESLQYLAEASQRATAAGRSPVRHLLSELELRIRRAEPAEAQRVFNQIKKRHWSEPGVADATLEVFSRFGVSGRRPPEREESVAEATPTGQSPLWTPASVGEPPVGDGGGQESKLWVPGDG